jgi:hypothetical protein
MKTLALVVPPSGPVTKRSVDVDTHAAVKRELGTGNWLTVEGTTDGHGWLAVAGLERDDTPNDRASAVVYADWGGYGYERLRGTVLLIGYDVATGAESDISDAAVAAITAAVTSADT